MRKALMISYYFPPMAGPGVQRVLYFAKYLPEFGYRPLVVHGSERPQGGPLDPTLREQVPSVVRFCFPPRELACLTAPVIRRLGRLGPIGEGLAWRLGLVAGLVNRCLSPDPLVFWAKALVDRVVNIVARHDVKVIFSTGDPFSNHYLAWCVKQRTGIPWVADFRDLWTEDERYEPTPMLRVRRDRYFESKFLNDADAVVNVSEGYDRAMRRLVRDEAGEKYHVIRNGVDLAAFPERREPENELFTLRYVGGLQPSRWSPALMAAIARVNAERHGGPSVLLNVVGRMGSTHLTQAKRLLANAFGFDGYASHDAAISAMLSSDALLLLVNRGRNAEGVVTGKLYEYLASGRPILCLTSVDGEAAQLVRQHGAGLVANIDSEEEVYSALKRLYIAWLGATPIRGACREELGLYDRRSLTGCLAAIFDRLAGPRR